MAQVENHFAQNREGERELHNHLTQIIEFKEQVESNTRLNGVSEKEIFTAVYPYLSKILKTRPLNGRLKDTRHDLRQTALTILQLFYNHIYHNESADLYQEMLQMCFQVLTTDSEEIADTAVKILGQFFTMQQHPHRKVQLIEFRDEIISFCKDFLEFLSQVPTLAKNFTPQELETHPQLLPAHLRDTPQTPTPAQKTFQTYGCRSLKLAAKFIHQLLRQYWSDRSKERVIESVKEALFNIFKSPNSLQEEVTNANFSQKLKSVTFFTKGLENMAILFHTVQFLLPNNNERLNSESFKVNIQYLEHNFGNLIHFFIILAKSLPGYATDMRYQALVGFYSVYNKTFTIQLDEEHRAQVEALQLTVKNVLQHFLDQLLDVAVLLGTGQVSYQIVHESANLVYRLFELLKDKISTFQLAKAMQMLLHCLLNPLTPLILKSTIIFCLYRFNQELRKKNIRTVKPPDDVSQKEFQNYDLQIEVLGQMTLLCKNLNRQTAQGVQYFKENPSTQCKQEPSEPDLFSLKERELEEACNQSFKLSWQHICSTVDPQQPRSPVETSTLAQKKEHYSRTAKNLFLFVDNILQFIKELQGKQTLSLEAMHHVEKFFVHGCHLIQNLSEILGPNEEVKMKEVVRSFQILLQELRSSQFRDLLQASGDQMFGLIIECKAKGKEGGVSIVSKYFMQFSQPVQNNTQPFLQKHPDDFVAIYLDMFFGYIRRKIPVFDLKFEDQPEMRFGLTKQDKQLALLPFVRIQEIMQKKLLSIGEQCLHRANDIRVKHTFFGVFMFCVQQIRSGCIVPRYFTIIRNLWKEICNLDDQSVSIKEIMKDFIPMVQGLIETFLQQKDEVTYVKYTKEICCFVPAKLKHLLDYLPEISLPLVENMESNSNEQVESGIHTLQYWLTALVTYPEIFDPVITPVLPDLNACLKPLLTYYPNMSLKLLGKLGAKTRQYDRNNEFKPRNYSEDGLKVTLQDKHSKEQIVFGIDAIIDVLLIKILSYGEQFLPSDLSAAVAFVKCAFLTYVDKDFDLQYVIAQIVQAKHKEGITVAPPLFQSFDASKPQEPISQMTYGSESHVFEKILRCLIIGCSSLPVSPPEFEAVAKEHTAFMKWVTQYFTLIYICKNKSLTKPTQLDEINPLLFLDYICEFLYYNINQGLTVKKNKTIRPYYKGSSFAIKTMLRLLTQLYQDQTDAFDNLEIVPILIQKVCNQVDELPKNLAVNIAIKILIKELPQRTLKKNCQVILKTLFQILTVSPDSVVVSVQQELRPTLDALFQQIGVYTFKQNDITTVEDRNIFNFVVDMVLQNLVSSQQMARTCAKYFLEQIASRNKIKVQQLLRSVTKADQQGPQPLSWFNYLFEFELEKKVKDVFDMFCGGYAQVLQLVAFIDTVQFVLEHGEPAKIQERLHVFIGIAEFMLIALEDESEKFETVLEQLDDPAYMLGPNSSIVKLTKRYMKLERVYLQQNKKFDSYSHTIHTHQFLTTHFFEVTQQARDQKLKKDVEQLNLKQSNVDFKIFQKPATGNYFENLSEDAQKVLSDQDEIEEVRKTTRKKIEDFTVKMFGSQIAGAITPPSSGQRHRVQDISYDYMHDLYEIYPNVRLHCQLTCKMLEVVCDIVNNPVIQSFIKVRQAEYFESYATSPEEDVKMQPPEKLLTRFDFYVVEIKAKVICMQFKFFQRDERNVQKKAKDCIKRLLRTESVPNEALPNFILKECVRPILNSQKDNRNIPVNFQHLSKLIKVCYSCFNEALGKHLTTNYEYLEQAIKEPYNRLNAATDRQLGRQELQDEVGYLVDQYNIKVQQIEISCGIINSLHYLCQSKPQILPEISVVMQKAYYFELFLVEDFERKFDDQLTSVLRADDPHRLIPFTYDKISPLQIKIGYLRSDLKQGIAKFLNQNYKEVVEILSKTDQIEQFLQILQLRENFSLRERLSRDSWIRTTIHDSRKLSILDPDKQKFDSKYVLAINLVYIFSKFHPQYLLQQRSVQILDGLREKWINKAFADAFLLSENKNLYMKIQKILVIYSRNESSEIQILFDLLKEFQLNSAQHDMRPLVKLCTQEIPNNASVQKQIKIMEAALQKIATSSCKYEAKYCMFEFAFMPIALQTAQSKAKYDIYFTPKMITIFLATFFGKNKLVETQDPVWKQINQQLETRQKISYQSFFTEIIKVLMLMLRFSSFKTIQQCCPGEDCLLVYRFLDWITKNATDTGLKELAFYTMSCFGVRILNLQLSGELPLLEDADMEMQPSVNTFLTLLSDNVLAPFFEIDLDKAVNKTTIKHTLANLVAVFQDPRVLNMNQSKYKIWQFFKRRYSLKPQQQFRLSLSNLVAKQSMACEVQDPNIYRRLRKTVEQFVAGNFNGISIEMMGDCKQPLNLIDALLLWTQRRKDALPPGADTSELQNEAFAYYTIVTKLYDIFILSFPNSQQITPGVLAKAKECFADISVKCLEILKTIRLMFPQPQSYTPPDQLTLATLQDADKIQYKAIFNLNICGMGLTQNLKIPNNFKFLFDFFRGSYQQQARAGQLPQGPLISFSSINFRLILYPIHLLVLIIRKKQLPPDQLAELKLVVRKAMLNDVKKSNERDIKFLQGQLVRDFLKQQGNVMGTQQAPIQALQTTRNEEMRSLQRCLPHLSIRMTQALEQLRSEGVIDEQEFDQWVDPSLYKDTNNSIFRIVSFFRQVVTSEKQPLDQQPLFNTQSMYEQFTFPNDQCEFSLEQPNFDMWIKESIMIAIKSIVTHMKQRMHQDEAFVLFDNLKLVLKVFLTVKTCKYLLEQLFEITSLLVEDSQQDRTSLQAKEKASWLLRLLNTQRLKEDPEPQITNKVYSLCLDFLEKQSSLLSNDTSLKVFDRLFWLKPCCSYPQRQRMFQLFEKFQGSALKHKLQYFMYKVSSEDYDQFVQFCQINNLLDFTLYNFKQNVSIYSIRDSSKLIEMHSSQLRFEVPPDVMQHASYKRIASSLEFFGTRLNEFRGLMLEDLLMPLSEIIRINPEHSHDRDIAGKIFSKIFWQYWQKILQRQDHHQLAFDFNKMTQNMIKYNSINSVQNKTQFARTMLEQIVAFKTPQVRLEPEVLQYMAKHFNLWHLAIPMLEDHVQLFPHNERYVFALQELYSGLMEEDLSMGLCRLTTKSPEMRSLYTFAQHQMWEQINSQFSQYINFYAEQEGLFSFLETSQQTPNKYSRQLSRNAIIDMVNGVDPLLHITKPQPANANFSELFEHSEQPKVSFPKQGSNRAINQLDLRTWESLYIQSLKVLKKNELFRDIAENMSGLDMHEMRIDYCWSVKDMGGLKSLLEKIIGPTNPQVLGKWYQINPGSIQKVRYHLYQNYILGIQGDSQSRNFDENFKDTVKLVIKQWSEYLPSYMDKIQNEYLILFQQIMESNEGGRNMINNQEIQIRKISEYRCAMNIWRERLPNQCESIQTWQDILESRNFIFSKLRDNIIRQQQLQNTEAYTEQSLSAHEEPVDICWNILKLASVSRKHGLYGLAQHYLNEVKTPLLSNKPRGDKLVLERFRLTYETNKLMMLTCSDSQRLQELIRDNHAFVECPDYDLWMHAEVLRLQGEFMLSRGDLNQAKTNLLASINKNKKEAKTWISYAKLNEVVQEGRNDERSAQNALKGYFCATGLNQHKARLIIPYVLKIVKSRHHANSQNMANFVKQNVDQLPTWLWLFWIPQLLQLLKQPKKSLQHESAITIYQKLCRLYPQPSYYPLRAKIYCLKTYLRNNPLELATLTQLMNYCKKVMRTKTPKVLDAIEILISEMGRVFKTQDENFLHILQSIFNFSQFYKQKEVELKMSKFYQMIYKLYLEKSSQPQVQSEFYKYFINPETAEKGLTRQMVLLKNIKDYLLIQKNLKAQTQTLEEAFPQLAGLCVKGMELPDQYIISSQEPVPEKVITIEKIDQTVHRAGIIDKKVQFKCSNGKALAYTFSTLNNQKLENDYNQNLSEERVNQLKLIMNMLFLRHKESTRRGVKFHVAPRTLLPGSKMTQEDLSFTDFQETHDYLLLEQGIDQDSALLSQLDQINKIFGGYPATEPQVLFSIDAQQVEQINLKTYRQLCGSVEPYLLTSYFNRIFYNHDNLFIFKKQFTKYHAANSLFAYAFNQTEYLKLSSLLFCKSTGALNFTETKLTQAISHTLRPNNFEQTEQEYFRTTEESNNLPFRLTPNLVHFMGQIGLHGIFAGTLTSASLALSAYEHKLQTVLQLIFSEEITDIQDPSQLQQLATVNAQFCMHKIKSLSNHSHILDQPMKIEELKARQLRQTLPGLSENRQTGDYVLGSTQVPREMFDLEMERPKISEEFNKKVFTLIEMAQEEQRLAQKPINWCAWF